MSFQMQNGRYRKMKWDNVIWGMLLIPLIDILMCLEINMIRFMKYVTRYHSLELKQRSFFKILCCSFNFTEFSLKLKLQYRISKNLYFSKIGESKKL